VTAALAVVVVVRFHLEQEQEEMATHRLQLRHKAIMVEREFLLVQIIFQPVAEVVRVRQAQRE
jgi:hypothetical protein